MSLRYIAINLTQITQNYPKLFIWTVIGQQLNSNHVLSPCNFMVVLLILVIVLLSCLYAVLS